MKQCAHLWEEAIEELARIRDEHVTAILADIAEKNQTRRLREKTALAFWHNTADSQFKNTEGEGLYLGLQTRT